MRRADSRRLQVFPRCREERETLILFDFTRPFTGGMTGAFYICAGFLSEAGDFDPSLGRAVY